MKRLALALVALLVFAEVAHAFRTPSVRTRNRAAAEEAPAAPATVRMPDDAKPADPTRPDITVEGQPAPAITVAPPKPEPPKAAAVPEKPAPVVAVPAPTPPKPEVVAAPIPAAPAPPAPPPVVAAPPPAPKPAPVVAAPPPPPPPAPVVVAPPPPPPPAPVVVAPPPPPPPAPVVVAPPAPPPAPKPAPVVAAPPPSPPPAPVIAAPSPPPAPPKPAVVAAPPPAVEERKPPPVVALPKAAPPPSPVVALAAPSAKPAVAAGRPDPRLIENIFHCFSPGLPNEWKKAWVVVNENGPDRTRLDVKFYYAVRDNDDKGEAFTPCNARAVADSVYSLNDLLTPEQRRWGTARLLITSEGAYELKYDYPK